MKILFVIIHAGIGGIEKSFVNLLKELTKDNRLKIDVFIMTHKGVFLDEIKKYAYVYPENNNLRLIGISQEEAFSEGKMYGVKRLVFGFIAKYLSKRIAYKLMSRGIKMEQYDVAVSFMHNKTKSLYGGTNELVLERCEAKKKITFIHGDLINAKLNNEYNHKMYKKFDAIASVSDSCKKIFDNEWPELAFKSYTVHNTCDVEEINQLASEEISEKYRGDTVNFVTIARMDKVKGIDRTLKIISEIKCQTKPFKWFVIGGGDLLIQYKKYAKELGIDKECIFLGEKTNPYPYMKKADFLLSCSYQEAAPMVYIEAQTLGIPILTTKTLSSLEMVTKKKIGIVCENNDTDLKSKLIELIDNRERLLEIKKNYIMKQDNSVELEEFYNIINKK